MESIKDQAPKIAYTLETKLQKKAMTPTSKPMVAIDLPAITSRTGLYKYQFGKFSI